MKTKKHLQVHRVDSRRNEIEIELYLRNHPFATLTEIAKRKGYLTNTQQTQKFLDRLVEENKVHKAHWWEKTVYFLDKHIPPYLLNTVHYLILKEQVFSKLNQICSQIPELSEFLMHYGIEDLTCISKNIFCKKLPLGNVGLNNNTSKKNQILIKYLKNIFCEIHIRILENDYAEKNNVREDWCGSKKQFRESRLYELFSELDRFLDKNWQDKNPHSSKELKQIAKGLDSDYLVAKMFLSNLSKHGRHSSFYLEAMIADKMGKKDDFAEEHGLKIPTVTKMTKKFNNEWGIPDLGLMYKYRCEEDASDGLCSPTDDIYWFSEVSEARDDLNSTRILGEDNPEKQLVNKRIKRVFPKMEVF